MDENERQNIITEGRQLMVAAPALDPILTKLHKSALQELLGNFRDKLDTQTAAAKLFVIDQIRREIDIKINLINQLGEKQ